MPRAEEVLDPLQPRVPPVGREPRRLARGEPFRRERAGDVLAVPDRFGEDAAEAAIGQRPGVPCDVPRVFDDGCRPRANRFECRHGDHQGGFLAFEQAPGGERQAIGVREAEVLVEAAGQDGPHVRVAVDEARKERLAPAIVHLGPRIRLEDVVGRADRHDHAALDGKGHVVLHAIGVHHRGVREDDGVALCLRVHAAVIEQHGGGAGTGADEQPAPVGVGRRNRRRPGFAGRHVYCPATEYFVNAPPAKRSEFGPSAAYTLPSASTATPSPAAPWYGRLSASCGGM